MLPTSTRVVKIMEMNVENEARRVVIFRPQAAEDSPGVDVGGCCWSIGATAERGRGGVGMVSWR